MAGSQPTQTSPQQYPNNANNITLDNPNFVFELSPMTYIDALKGILQRLTQKGARDQVSGLLCKRESVKLTDDTETMWYVCVENMLGVTGEGTKWFTPTQWLAAAQSVTLQLCGVEKMNSMIASGGFNFKDTILAPECPLTKQKFSQLFKTRVDNERLRAQQLLLENMTTCQQLNKSRNDDLQQQMVIDDIKKNIKVIVGTKKRAGKVWTMRNVGGMSKTAQDVSSLAKIIHDEILSHSCYPDWRYVFKSKLQLQNLSILRETNPPTPNPNHTTKLFEEDEDSEDDDSFDDPIQEVSEESEVEEEQQPSPSGFFSFYS
jgi:hypothetical protein